MKSSRPEESPYGATSHAGAQEFHTADPRLPESSTAVRLEEGCWPLPEYQLVRKLGEGGFGQVWLATGPGGFEVALKFLPLAGAAGVSELHALQAIKGIRHAHLLTVFGLWEKDGYLIVAMELADRSLSDRLKVAVAQGLPGIPIRELMGYLTEAAKGLDYLNDKGIVHRDVKPHNLFLAGNSVKVADYGLAKVLERSQSSASTKLTPAYSAPEFFNGQVTKWSDQYSLAVAYCQLRGNRLPFKGGLQEQMSGHLLKEPDLSMVPAEERPVVRQALAKEPSQRWPSCLAFVEALGAAQSTATDPGLVVPAVPMAEAADTQQRFSARAAALWKQVAARKSAQRYLLGGSVFLAVVLVGLFAWALWSHWHNPQADGKPDESQIYGCREGNFAIRLAGPPETGTYAVSLGPLAPIYFHAFLVEDEEEDTTCAVAFTDVPETALTDRTLLNLIGPCRLAGIYPTATLTVTATRPADFKGFPGAQYTVQVRFGREEETATAIVRVYVVHKRIYVLFVGTSEELPADAPYVQDFFASFDFLAAPTPPK
jgi:hypothetical protein